MGGTPHLLNYADSFEKQTASFTLVKPRLLAGNADVLAVMNHNSFCNIAVVVFNLNVIDCIKAGGFNAPHSIPVLSFRRGNRSLMSTVKLTGIRRMLSANSALDDTGRCALLTKDCSGHVVQCAFAQQTNPMGQLFAYTGCTKLFPVAVSIEVSAQQCFAQLIICSVDPSG